MPETVPAGDSRGLASDAPTGPDEPPTRSDPELIAATRGGDTTAYAVLYERHVHAARRLARILSRDPAGADDLVSETFAKLLHTFREGGGPDLAFRPYMLQTLRNTFYDRVRRDKKVEFTDDLTKHDSGEVFADPAVEGQERRYAALAFGKLPERWRMVLWHTEVEEDPPAKIAVMLGMTPNGVSALAYRAREKLRQNYLSEHAADSPREECRWTVDRLGARVRGKLGERDESKVDAHVGSCVTCNLLFAELTELNSGLRTVIAGVFLGAAAAPYLAAGVASAAGLAFGGAFAFLFAPFKAAANWIRRIVQQLGTKGAVASGTAVAVAAAVVVFALTSDEEEPPPQAAPEGSVAEPVAPDEEPELPGPPVPEPEPEDPVQPDDPEPRPEPEPEPGEEPEAPAEPVAYSIEHGLGATGLVAGGEAVLPIRLAAPGNAGGGYAPVTERAAEPDGTGAPESVLPTVQNGEPASARPRLERRAPESMRPALETDAAAVRPSIEAAPRGRGQAASERVTLDISLPEGVSLASETAEPGWSCAETDAVVHCTVAAMPDPAEAHVRLLIGEDVSGYQTFEVAVRGPGIGGTTALQVPIAPAGSRVGYASLDATGVTAAGNTWLTCSVPGCREAALVGGGDTWPMKAYKPGDAPAGREGEAVSGAVLEIPGGAEIAWAGLYWAGVHEDLPADVSLAGPGGSWTDLSAETMRDTNPGVQAFTEVTGLVSGGGEYWVATDNHRLPTGECPLWPIDADGSCGEPHWAGWALTVVYAEPGAEAKEVAVYDGAPAADTAIEVEDGGEVDIAATLWGGSAYRGGDRLTAGGQGLGEPAACRANGAVENPNWYAFGVDVVVHRVRTGEQAVIRFERGDDPFIVGVVAIAEPKGGAAGT
ncbi:sigma-70 family RNA polymerase sigma factor [Glycomyces sp. TRM65418]|uniref:sigma-70 family RNA polymerase sigma factor n=1 Tax=Glycomyces sp. TRM65418 TaxID=2867006 RepID=UPI001CE6E735|nr:sigma-70 family RNA polymerase sigma factor [Glycomyces sp. TRM65418]MCC3762930.1 sigma-70 family RNA polymerase sigma factor [Glycomyces sp. TRM65418]QZD56954.1 sigma-70 family RNA polymerase sigma factor [Glycomyces sp. TRM65418]